MERSSLCAGYSIVFAFSVQALSVKFRGRLLPDSQTLLALQQNEGDIILSSMKVTRNFMPRHWASETGGLWYNDTTQSVTLFNVQKG